MFSLSNFRKKRGIHYPTAMEVEISTRCVSRCPVCPRTQSLNGVHEDLGWNTGFFPRAQLLQFVRNAPDLQHLNFCGAYGDAIYHPELLSILADLQTEFPTLQLALETVGSHRAPEWWRSLGETLGPRHSVTFSIDGLQDSNAIYRRGTDWNSIVAGIRALRATFAGRMYWKWIAFRHNQHQVADGARLARALGMDRFWIEDSRRHYEDSQPTIAFAELETAVRQAEAEPPMFI